MASTIDGVGMDMYHGKIILLCYMILTFVLSCHCWSHYAVTNYIATRSLALFSDMPLHYSSSSSSSRSSSSTTDTIQPLEP